MFLREQQLRDEWRKRYSTSHTPSNTRYSRFGGLGSEDQPPIFP